MKNRLLFTDLEPDRLYNLNEVAEVFGNTYQGVTNMIEDGRLEMHNLGPRCRRVKGSSVLALLEASKYVPKEATQ